MKISEIITTIIAAYGALLATITFVRQVRSDRVKVRVTIRKNMQIVGDPRYRGMTLTTITVTNVGRRPVTITTFGANGLCPNLNFVLTDSTPPLPCEITDGKYVVSKVDQADLDFSKIDYWAAWDSHGKMYKASEASWFKHLKSEFQLRRSFRKKKPASAKTEAD